MRILSELAVKMDGHPGNIWRPPSRTPIERSSLFCCRPSRSDIVSPDPQLRLDCFRRVEPGQLSETIVISSQLPRSTEVDVAVELSCDFARLNVIKAGQPTRARPIPVISGDHFAWVEEDIALYSRPMAPISSCPTIAANSP